MPCHYRSSTGEESPIGGDAYRCSPPHQDGRRACHAFDGDVLCYGIRARCSLDETLWVEVVDELTAEFQKLEEWCLRLERPGVRICDLLLGPPYGWA
jgi:hypothetical protein